MSNEELDQLATRMRHALAGQGVVSTGVHSYEPPIIALACDNAIAAERLKASLELVSKGARIEIAANSLSTVLRYY